MEECVNELARDGLVTRVDFGDWLRVDDQREEMGYIVGKGRGWARAWWRAVDHPWQRAKDQGE